MIWIILHVLMSLFIAATITFYTIWRVRVGLEEFSISGILVLLLLSFIPAINLTIWFFGLSCLIDDLHIFENVNSFMQNLIRKGNHGTSN